MSNTKLKELRQQAGLTQSEPARRTGVSRQAVALWESGQSKSLGSRNLFKVASILGIDPQHLLALDAHDTPLTDEERTALNHYRTLSARERRAVVQLMQALGKGNEP